MNWDKIEGSCKQVKGWVRSRWGKLMDDPLDVLEGHREQVAGKVQETYGGSRDQAENQIRQFEQALNNRDGSDRN